MASSSAAVVSDQLQVRALHPALGAEVRGVDMRTPLDPDTFSAVHDAWMQYLVLVFPGQQITDEEHVEFTRGFGEPEVFHQNIIRSRRVKEIFRVANVDDEGNLMSPDHPTVKQVSLAQFWHTDSSYRAIPCMGALLHGVETSKTGGETQFTNMYAVSEAAACRPPGAARLWLSAQAGQPASAHSRGGSRHAACLAPDGASASCDR